MRRELARALVWVCGALLSALVGGAACSHDNLDVPNAGPVLSADTQRIYESQKFVAFADSAHLDRARRIEVARTLALYGENEASLRATSRGSELDDMHQQLLRDTVAHVRAQIPDSAWDAFTRSGLLPELVPASNN